MKRNLFFLTLVLMQGVAISQPLSFAELGFEPAYCRLYNYQSGNGVVYAMGTGGTPPYTYQWKNLTTGATTTNTTWGGLNVADYEITLTDDIGTILKDTITLDSLNPIAAIGVISSGLTQDGVHYYGGAPATVIFENNSQYFANPFDPSADTNFFWRMTQFSPWNLVTDVADQNYTYNYGGNWSVHLVALNKNGCSDTAVVRLHLYNGLVTLDESENDFDLIVNSDQHELTVQTDKNINESVIRIYNLNGQLIREEQLNSSNTTFQFNFTQGIYLYEILDQNSTSKIATGKFVL